jgi:tetratricopeptide (TPR) repeat protein
MPPDRWVSGEKTIAEHEQALKLLKRQDDPHAWAGIHLELAQLYNDRVAGDPKGNVEVTIVHCKMALTCFTRHLFPERFGFANMVLAQAYTQRIAGDQDENVEKAVEHSREALSVLTRAQFPLDWAKLNLDLAGLLVAGCLFDEHPGTNVEHGLQHYKHCLSVYTKKEFPDEFAEVHMNLARTYMQRFDGDHSDNFELAIRHSNHALEGMKSRSHQQECVVGADMHFLFWVKGLA